MNSVWLKNLGCGFLFSTFLFSHSLEAAWSSPTAISQANEDSRFSLLVSAADTAVAVWLTYDTSAKTDVLFSATRSSVDGTWTIPASISSNTTRVINPILVVDSNNDCVLV